MLIYHKIQIISLFSYQNIFNIYYEMKNQIKRRKKEWNVEKSWFYLMYFHYLWYNHLLIGQMSPGNRFNDGTIEDWCETKRFRVDCRLQWHQHHLLNQMDYQCSWHRSENLQEKKIIRIALDALPFCFLQKYSIPILHDQYYLWMGKMRPMPKQHPSIWWPIVYDHRWWKIRVLHRIVIGIELMANLYQPYPKHNCQWHLKYRHVLYRLWISMIKHVDDVVTTNCQLYRQPNVCSGCVIVDRLQCQWLDHHVHNIPNYCIENKLHRLEHVFKTRSINLCSVTFECISKQL